MERIKVKINRENNLGGVLRGVRVLDLTHVVAGPYASKYLAMFGAEVIKIENPRTGGDINRFTGPFVNDFSIRFCNLNHNKQSVVIDLTAPEGKELFLKLVKESDIVLDNFRPGVLDKLGIGYEAMQAVNPKIVWGSVSGFGSYGPYRDLPAYDVISQAMSGIMYLNGSEEDPPMKVGTSIGDIVAGINLVVGVLAALREADQTGYGRRVEVSLVDSLVSSLMMDYVGYLHDGTVPPRLGNQYREWAPYGVYQASDGYYVLGVGTNAFFKVLATDILGRPDMAENPDYASHPLRVEHREEIDAVINDWSLRHTVEEICTELARHGIPYSRINTIRETAADEHIGKVRNMFPSYEQPDIGTVTVTNMPVRFPGTPEVPLAAAPGFGEQTRDALHRILNMTTEEIADLEKKGVILTNTQ